MKKIYIAGPDVFEVNAIEIGKRNKEICVQFGFEGFFPLDNEIQGSDKKDIATKIAEANIDLIKKCDIVVANLNPFRGKEPDSGTVWECGFGYALGKRVIYYMDDTKAYIDRFSSNEKRNALDSDGKIIEDFGLPVNLMISCTAEVVEGSFMDAIKYLKENN